MGGGDGDCADCVKVVQTTKKVQVPCTRNVYKTYKVKVPRQVTEVKPRTVNWVDMEDRQKPVTYTDYEMRNKIRYDKQSYQVPVQKPYTKMVPKTTKVPKTIYVDITKMVPTTGNRTEMQTRYRTVPVPYQVPVPVQKVKMETYKAPVNKSKVVYDKIQKTVYDTQIKTRCEPKTTMVTKTIPVFNVVPVPPKPMPQPGPLPGPGGRFPAPMPAPMPAPPLMGGGGMMAGGSMASGGMVSGPNGMMAGGSMASGGVAMGSAGGMAAGGSMASGGVAMGSGGGMVAGGSMASGGVVSSGGGMMHGGGGMHGHGGGMKGGVGVPITAEADLNNDGTIDAREFKIAAEKAKHGRR